ncbi:PQQ-binding-like beta-propeller repeat protein [Planctomicrobium sp. SH668]|uniref:PQQ-binding-like beta-propeller repeat protein n=1 Tax=Planctomicrobium sp. SH668 TaxID=3448126 RepID=UPI003F5C8586
MNIVVGLTCLFSLVLITHSALAEDWPQWMGAQRDNIWREEGLVDSIPEGGLDVLWRKPIHGGYGGPAVADGRIFVMDYQLVGGELKNDPNTRAVLQGTERILCLSEETGETLWEHSYDRPYEISYPAGPRCTPTVDGDRVYSLGAEGNLLCLEAATGKVIWKKDFQQEYQTVIPIWGISSHPLVYGDLLISVVGGDGSVVVAFDKHSGDEKWKAISAKEQGYAPPTLIHAQGVDQLLIWDAEKLSSLNPLTGDLYWDHPIEAAFGMSIMGPRLYGEHLFASAIGPAGGLYKLKEERRGLEEIWLGTTKSGVACANSTPFLKDDVIFGSDCKTGGLRAVDVKDGSVLWETFEPTTGTRRASHGTVFIVANQNRFILFSETGDLILANLTREKYEEIGRFHALEPTGEAFGRSVVWSAPAFSNGCCIARNDKEIVRISLKKK